MLIPPVRHLGTHSLSVPSASDARNGVWKSDLEGEQPHAQPGPTSPLRQVPSAGRKDTCDVFHFTSSVSFLSGGQGQADISSCTPCHCSSHLPRKEAASAAAPVGLTAMLRFVRNTHVVIQMTGNRFLLSLPGEPATTGGLELPVPSTPPLQRGEGRGAWRLDHSPVANALINRAFITNLP